MKLFLRILFTSFFILNYDQGLSQELDFHSPIDAPFDLSGTFGEYRSRFQKELSILKNKNKTLNHFFMIIYCKSNLI